MRRDVSRGVRLWYWPLLFAAAMALSWLIPPIQSPDEHSHLMRAYLVSKGQWTLATPPGMSSGGVIDKGLLTFVDAYLSTIAADAQVRLSEVRKAEINAIRWGASEHFFPIPGTGYYMPLVYVPHAAAMWMGRTLDLSVAASYQLVRVVYVLSCVLLLAWACRILEPPPLAFALLMLPMTLLQMLSPTLDGITTCLAVLALSVFWRRLPGNEDLRPAYTWIFAASLALLASSRVQLLPLLTLPFYLAWSRGSRRDAIAGVAAVLLSAGWLAYALTHTLDLRVKRDHGTAELLMQYAREPMAFFHVVAQSVADSELGRFYADSFIGVLGWLDTYLPLWSYPVLWWGLAACAAGSLLIAKPAQCLLARALLVGVALASTGMVFFALLVTWTPHPAAVVEGVQGRYFIVPALMVAYALGATRSAGAWRWPVWAVAISVSAVSLYALSAALLARYH